MKKLLLIKATMTRYGLLFLIFASILGMAATTTSGGTCQRLYNIPIQCTVYTHIYEGMWAFVPWNYTTPLMMNTLQTRLTTSRETLGVVRDCEYAAFETLCLSWVRGCIEADGLSLPIEPCESAFGWTNDTCRPIAIAAGYGDLFGSGIFEPVGDTYPTTAGWPDPAACGGNLFWTPDGTGYFCALNNGTNITVPCNGGGGRISNFTFASCQAPLQNIPGTDECVYTCPLPPPTQSQYDTLATFEATLGMLSLFLNGFLFFTTIINPHLRRIPLLLFLYLGGLVASISFIYPLVTGGISHYPEIWCAGNTAISPHQGTLASFIVINGQVTGGTANDLSGFTSGEWECGMIGFMLYFGLLLMLAISTQILLNQCYDLATLMWHWMRPDWLTEFRLKVVNVCVAGATCIILACIGGGMWAGGVMVFAVGSPVCFIDPNQQALQIVFFLVLVCALVIISLLATLFICGVLIREVIRLKFDFIAIKSHLPATFITLTHGLVMLACYIGVTYYAFNNLINHSTISNDVAISLSCQLFPNTPYCLNNNVTLDVNPIMASGAIMALVALLLPGVQLMKWRVWVGIWRFVRAIWRVQCTKGTKTFLDDLKVAFITSGVSTGGSLSVSADGNPFEEEDKKSTFDDEEDEGEKDEGEEDIDDGTELDSVV